MEAGDPHRLIGGSRPLLQARIVGGDAGRAGVAVCIAGAWMQPSANNKAACRDYDVGAGHSAQAVAGHHPAAPRRSPVPAFAQPVFDELVDHHRRRLAQRQADHVDEWLRGRTRAALGAIHGDEVGRGFDAAAIDFSVAS